MSEDRPAWKIMLSVCITLFMVGRLMYTCSNMNNQKSNYNSNPLPNVDYDYVRALREEQISTKSNQFLYLSYKQLDSVSESERKLYQVKKLEKDTLVSLDIETKIKIAKEWYLQKNYDDSLKLAFKTPENLTVFIHDFESKENTDAVFKSLKRGSDLKSVVMEGEDLKTITYTVNKNNSLFNGYAFCFKQDSYYLFLEFESNTINKEALKTKAITYFFTNIKASK
ncbi:hypothetical protein [Flavobacterium sp.]|uniref:hypothetical protein n=1 Tax=Flavobacterium sp. TaxID=239 RepID=UPI002B4B8D45|nr:hypothetical protein [Flavobacterium sp.]HLP64808.1 hypothetical protein [Flavobacterium sp.]